MSLKAVIKKNYYAYLFASKLLLLKSKIGGVKINNKGYAKISKSVIGLYNNIGENAVVRNLDICLYGVIGID